MFRKLLIANRGEIAIRVARAARELGVQTAGVYSDGDVGALYRGFVDESYRLGPPPPSESYLRIDLLIEVAVKCGADALHPGYGFLAENPALSAACRDAGIAFIGPTPEAMELAGDKITARKRMADAGVPVAAGSSALRDAGHAADEAAKIGYPVILKASGGGGGIGMQVVRREEEIARLFETAESTAKNAFANPTIFLEKYFERPRHIEIQFLADQHRHAIHLGERECSVQRRHQKLIEESPSRIVTAEMRRTLGEVTVRGMVAMGYTNAGTAEFLYADGRFHFNEINARLQVEHPVTEAVTGIDLVQQQILLAAGEELPIRQEEVQLHGHALECRINAEDPLDGFLPSPGRITEFQLPGGAGVRVDTGVASGSVIPEFYDSLIAKVIVHGHTRHASLARMRRALEELRVEGVATNREFHLAALATEAFQRGDLSTRFIEEERIEETLRATAHQEREAVAAVAAILAVEHEAAARFRRRVVFRSLPASAWGLASRPGRRL